MKWEIIAVNLASVKSTVYVKKYPSGRIFSEKDFFLIVENFIQCGQEKIFFHEMLERVPCNGQLGDITDQIKTF